MTTLEHVSVKHALDRLPSWVGEVDVDGHGNGGRDQDQGEVEVGPESETEEVGVGVAVTTDDDELVGIALEGPDSLRSEHEDGGRDRNGGEDDEGGGDSVVGSGLGSLGLGALGTGASRPSPSPLGSRGRSRSPSDSNSNSNSRSPRSSMRGPLGMGESSTATSWTQVDVEGGGVEGLGVADERSRDGESGRRTSGEGGCRSNAVEVEHGIDAAPSRTRAPGDRIEVESPSRLRTSMEGGDVSRKEEVLVIQEEDIGEGWHPSRYNGKARSHDEEGETEKGEAEEDVTLAHALESERDGSRSLELNEKDRWQTFGSSGSRSASGSRRDVRHLRLEFKQSSPQPWDEIDPPTDNNDMFASDYYSTLNSKKFATLQKGHRRPLIPHSTYYFGPPPSNSGYGTPPVGQMGVHHPREIVRIERDYAGGELTQFSPVFPLELEGRITPTQFHQTINDVNEILISAHSIRHAFIDNFLAVVTLQLSTLIMTSHYKKEMRRLKQKIEELNTQLYNPVGLNILWPQKVAFLFLEIEYY